MSYMSFSNLVGVGSDCGRSNGLTNLMNHFGKNRDLQQDRFQRGEGSKVVIGFRNHSSHALNSDSLANEFFQQDEHFDRSNVSSPFQPLQSIKEDWTRDFEIHQSHSPYHFEDFEYIYQRYHSKSPIQPWADEFSIFQQAASSEVSEEEQLAFERAFEEAADENGIDHRYWDKEFANHDAWEEAELLTREGPVYLDNVSLPCSKVGNDFEHFVNHLDLSTNETQTALPQSKENNDDRVEESERSELQEVKYEKKEWNRLKPTGIPYGYRALHPEYKKYECMADNPYLLRQDAIDGVPHTTLADEILALEAKSQLNPEDAKTWEQLGLKQQENERDAAAITALEKAVSLDSSCLDAWLALSVSYTNEHCCMDAYNCLEQWISNSPKYKHILQEALGRHHADEKKRHSYITNLFLEAARTAPGEEMDADVQVALGVLFNMSEEYGKAVDCFKSALISRPYDYQLWNKVGATLANSRDSTGAVEMYFNALQINPSYVRARYNLAICCMNLGQHQEAAEHLLTTLALQRAAALSAGKAARISENGLPVNITNGTSAGIWDSLRLLMYILSREDLAAECDHRNLDAFHGYFDF